MNRTKRTCALLLVLGIALQPGIGGVFADENTEQTEQITGLTPEPAAEPTPESTVELIPEPTPEPATEPAPEPTAEPEESPAPSFCERLIACGSLTEFDAMLRAEENTAALEALTQEELKQLLERVEELYAALEEPAEADARLKEELLKELNDRILVFCPECGAANGHAESCSQYKAEDEEYAWAALTDAELAAWLMDEANAEAVKAILQSEGEEYEALMERIDAILDGDDEELAMKLQEYLSALTGLEAEPLAPDEYIYFDLEAGCVEIGAKTYSGWVFVEGVKTEVKGEHKDSNQYYIYQSNPTVDTASAGHYLKTGYELQSDFDAEPRQGCRVPEYPRVKDGA